MRIVRNEDVIIELIKTKKKIFLWGCSEITKKFLQENENIDKKIEGIIDSNHLNIKDTFFSKFSIYNIAFLNNTYDSLLFIHGNHCKSIFEQLKSINFSKNIDILFDYNNGAQKIFNKHLYVNTEYNIIKLNKISQKLDLTTITEQKFINNGGNILIHFNEAKKVFSSEQIIKAHIDFLNNYINNRKVYVGCGEDYRTGYLHCDKRDFPHVDIVCDAWSINNKIMNLTNIYSRHMLEHLTEREAQLTLLNWYDALNKDGELELIVPNFDLRAKQWLDCNWNEDDFPTIDEKWAFAGCWGWQRECDPIKDNYNQSYWDVHKSGYNEKRITVILKKIGFKDIKTKVDEKNNLIAIAYKR